MPVRATQGAWVVVKSSDKVVLTGGRNDTFPQCSCHENPMNNMNRQKAMTPAAERPQVGRCPVCYWEKVEGNY